MTHQHHAHYLLPPIPAPPETQDPVPSVDLTVAGTTNRVQFDDIPEYDEDDDDRSVLKSYIPLAILFLLVTSLPVFR